MLSVCSKHLPQESKFQQKLAEMSEYYFSHNLHSTECLGPTQMKTLPNTTNVIWVACLAFVRAAFNLENADHKMEIYVHRKIICSVFVALLSFILKRLRLLFLLLWVSISFRSYGITFLF